MSGTVFFPEEVGESFREEMADDTGHEGRGILQVEKLGRALPAEEQHTESHKSVERGLGT